MEQFIAESIAKRLAQIWAKHRDPMFVEYLLETFGCEPLKPVSFAGILSLQVIGGYFFPDLPTGSGPIVERLWLTDDAGFRPTSLEVLRAVENLECDNPLVVYDASRKFPKPITSQPWLLVYPRYKFFARGDKLIYYEQFGFLAGCTKVANIVVSDRVEIREVCPTETTWQGRLKELAHTGPD